MQTRGAFRQILETRLGKVAAFFLALLSLDWLEAIIKKLLEWAGYLDMAYTYSTDIWAIIASPYASIAYFILACVFWFLATRAAEERITNKNDGILSYIAAIRDDFSEKVTANNELFSNAFTALKLSGMITQLNQKIRQMDFQIKHIINTANEIDSAGSNYVSMLRNLFGAMERFVSDNDRIMIAELLEQIPHDELTSDRLEQIEVGKGLDLKPGDWAAFKSQWNKIEEIISYHESYRKALINEYHRLHGSLPKKWELPQGAVGSARHQLDEERRTSMRHGGSSDPKVARANSLKALKQKGGGELPSR